MIAAYERWVCHASQLDDLVRQIDEAFAGQTLGDGTGLLEAIGLDNYAGEAELADLRAKDEAVDWRRIDVETLDRCYPAPFFMNARGFVFHLPAFLIAELNDRFSYGFIDRLIGIGYTPDGWRELLTDAQRNALVATLTLIAFHPDYCDKSNAIGRAIAALHDDASSASD